MENIKVSICCITYNHENYIRDAIESFLMQKVEFPIEILIHDDASTDNTARIIKEYEKDYPEIIKPIYQIENQHSKKIKISSTYLYPNARGEYIAICEGDDYWTDPYKLQKQIDYLEKHPECSLVIHAAKIVNAIDNQVVEIVRPSKTSKTFNVEELILGGGGFFATNSMVYRSKYGKNLPAFYNNAPIGDFPLTIYLSLAGEVYYMDQIMSVYRYLVPGSWTSSQLGSIEKQISHSEKILKMFDEIDLYSNYKYSSIIEKKKAFKKFNLLIQQGKINEAKKNDTFNFYSSLSFKHRLSLNMNKYFPGLLDFLRKKRRKSSNAKAKY